MKIKSHIWADNDEKVLLAYQMTFFQRLRFLFSKGRFCSVYNVEQRKGTVYFNQGIRPIMGSYYDYED